MFTLELGIVLISSIVIIFSVFVIHNHSWFDGLGNTSLNEDDTTQLRIKQIEYNNGNIEYQIQLKKGFFGWIVAKDISLLDTSLLLNAKKEMFIGVQIYMKGICYLQTSTKQKSF